MLQSNCSAYQPLMSRDRVYQLRLNDFEWEKLRVYALSKQISPAEALRDFIKKLPNPNTDAE